MAFLIEDGSGVVNANAYVTEAFALTYLTDRNRETENTWSTRTAAVRRAAIIAATDYIEKRWREHFKGSKKFLALLLAKGVLTFSQNPTATETVVIGSVTYTFQTALSTANDILIGADASVTLDNLAAAITASSGEGTLYGTGTVVHPDASASAFDLDTLVIEAKVDGLAGNLIATTTTVTAATLTAATLLGGSDVGLRQPLSFPRLNLSDIDGVSITGIPARLKQATVEYAVRAVAAILQPDPTVDLTGRTVIGKREHTGPIEEETRYQEGGRISITKPYPAADALLGDFIRLGGTLIRA